MVVYKPNKCNPLLTHSDQVSSSFPPSVHVKLPSISSTSMPDSSTIQSSFHISPNKTLINSCNNISTSLPVISKTF